MDQLAAITAILARNAFSAPGFVVLSGRPLTESSQMKPIIFISIEDAPPEPGKTKKVEQTPSEPVNFYELTESGEENQKTSAVVESDVRHEDAVNFYEISDVPEEETEQVDESEPEEETKDPDPVVEEAPSSSTVMVVEDDNIVSTMLKHLLERRGYQIEIASDGRKAVELIESEIPPALVILDVMLPFVDGFELIRQIRENESWEKVPIIMLTAKTREEDIVRALESGANDYIVKPFQPQELIARVKRFVRQ